MEPAKCGSESSRNLPGCLIWRLSFLLPCQTLLASGILVCRKAEARMVKDTFYGRQGAYG
jgi:hypothetical protein